MNGPDEDQRRRFEREPERLQWELDRLSDLDLEPALSKDELGRLVLTVDVPGDERAVRVRVVFPSEYPFLAPRVWGPPGFLKRHQNPAGGNLCLVDDEGTWWRPHYPAAWLISKLTGLLEAVAKGEEAVSEGEADTPEPLTGHFSCRRDVVVLVDDQALSDDLGAKRGTFTLAEVASAIKVLTKLEAEGSPPRHLDRTLGEKVGIPDRAREISGEWFDLDEFPEATAWREVIDRAKAEVQAGARTRRRGRGGRRRLRGSRTAWIGISFFEEGPGRHQRRRAWLFFELKSVDAGSLALVGDAAVCTQAVSRAVRRQRTRELAGLEGTRFLVVGAGSIGGSLVLELVKADAGQIDLIDPDDYDLNNSVRHVLATSASGENKAKAIARLAADLNPFARVVPHDWSVGSEGRGETVAKLVDECAVVVDATGSHAITRLLHRDCARGGTPLVSVALTPGAYAGRVLTLRAASPCLDCFFAGQDDGSIPQPPGAPPSNFTPYGCSHPAASGAGFDVTELVAVAARRTVQAADVTEYPGPGTDWIVVSFRDHAPGARYQEGPLAAKLDCESCS